MQPTQTVKTLNGDDITINVADGKATITDGQGNTVNITTTDLKTKNGIIHVIDRVLLAVLVTMTFR
ncbi:MAG: fasciclin domain-containing protein [Acidimicrobiia bacterium]